MKREGRQSTGVQAGRLDLPGARHPQGDAARKRAAVEMIAEHGASLKRTARRYSLDAEDAEDAYQRALEIALVKAPTTDPRELIRWTQTVTKHEALAVRQSRERLLGRGGGGAADPVALLPAGGDGPDEQAERREAVARSREALRALKPAELRALSLLAEGYSYAEIGELTGFSQTKINRVLAEGRNRFRGLLASSEDGSRCRELRPLLSAFCDGEANAEEEATVREHLRACARCRATMRTYRAAPRIAIVLAPGLVQPRSLLQRLRELVEGLGSRLPGVGGDGSATQIAAAGGSKGIGMAGLAKLLALCAGAAGGAAVCAATGVLPAPDLEPRHSRPVTIERSAVRPATTEAIEAPQDGKAPAPERRHEQAADEEVETESSEAGGTGAIEYEPAPAPPPPAPAPTPAPTVAPTSGSTASAPSSGSAAGEFGP